MSILLTAVCLASTFVHSLQSEPIKPWTSKPFLDDPQEFHFAVVPDRTGGERKGIFPKAMEALNRLRPEFVMTVGDLIACGGKPDVDKQWDELQGFIGMLDMRFFYTVGNHDIWSGITGMDEERARSIKAWKARFGRNTYYNFMYKGCHFISFDTMEKHDYFPPHEALSEAQIEFALKEIEKHSDARWHFMFMHKPLDWTSDRWLEFERKINKYNYTVFCGDWHNHVTATRHGKKYYMIGTAGGIWDNGVTRRDDRYGVMDSVTWVTMTKEGPIVSHIEIEGVHGDTIQTCDKSMGWIEAPLDYPSHLAEDPAKYANVKNTALIPTEVMHGPGYDWHFRHAIILRQGLVYEVKMEDPGIAVGIDVNKTGRRVMLLGDESASALAEEYKGDIIFDMGFKGDKIENVLWRVIQGEIRGYEPAVIVISVGKHNRGVNSEDEINAGIANLIGYVRQRAPKAEIVIK